jgi:formate hydrogenlyase transcriptional activator
VESIDPERTRYAEERRLRDSGYGSFAAFPLIAGDEVLGTLEIAHPPDRPMLGSCFTTASQVARLLAIALHNGLLIEETRRLNRLLGRENAILKEEIRESRRGARYVAESPIMKEVVARVALVGPVEATVLIRGETGTGKEGLARMIHEFSPRMGGPFVVVNLGAVPETLIESELFGHEKGAFTGATERRIGRFEQAAGGTIFLDEIGDAPPSLQVRLLRVLQEREIQRVGGNERVHVDVRVVVATHRPLEAMVEEGRFRSDLYYRLNAFPLNLPPLRERREDIRPLAEYFLSRHAERMHRKPPALSEAALRALESYRWPGNVRELENFLERSLILSPGTELVLADLPHDGPPPVTPPEGRPVARFHEAVPAILRQALAAAKGRIYGPSGAAALLGLRPTTLQGKMRKYGLRSKG